MICLCFECFIHLIENIAKDWKRESKWISGTFSAEYAGECGALGWCAQVIQYVPRGAGHYYNKPGLTELQCCCVPKQNIFFFSFSYCIIAITADENKIHLFYR